MLTSCFSVVFNEDEHERGRHSVLIWGGEEQERLYSVVDCKTGIDQVPQTLCFGPRVACLAKVGERYWLGTEVSFENIYNPDITYYTTPYHTIPYHTIPYHTIPYHTTPHHTTPHHTTPHHTTPHHTTPHHTTPHHTTPHHTTPHHTTPHHTIPYHISNTDYYIFYFRVLLSKCLVAQNLVAT